MMIERRVMAKEKPPATAVTGLRNTFTAITKKRKPNRKTSSAGAQRKTNLKMRTLAIAIQRMHTMQLNSDLELLSTNKLDRNGQAQAGDTIEQHKPHLAAPVPLSSQVIANCHQYSSEESHYARSETRDRACQRKARRLARRTWRRQHHLHCRR